MLYLHVRISTYVCMHTLLFYFLKTVGTTLVCTYVDTCISTSVQMGVFLSRACVLREPAQVRCHAHLWPHAVGLRVPGDAEAAYGALHRRAGQDASREEDPSHHAFPKVSVRIYIRTCTCMYVVVHQSSRNSSPSPDKIRTKLSNVRTKNNT